MTAESQKRNRQRGRYAKSPACRRCSKPCPVDDYLSHPMTDCIGDDGVPWGDAAIVLCENCYQRCDHMRNVSEFVRYRDTGYF